ncbi:GNAT family protein [Pedobacter antarcticus]|uniref:GNAT family N-acetyltransferase n=1 Tax=Pedobacter antarcticus TaxID=34086 RepID=UPI002930E49D|nr:GNAT family protein [Pedobacter antarcticus]
MTNKDICSAELLLENENVLLRALELTDLEYLLPFALNEPELWYYSLHSAAGEDQMKAYIKAAVAERENGKSYPFIVFDKKSGTYAGVTRFYDINAEFKTLLLGYTWYGKAYQGTGLNKNCKYLLFQYAFERLQMERIEFRADAENARSIAAMKSIGCKEEGRLRSHMPNGQGGRRDSVILSMLRVEWFEECGSRLLEKL